MKFTTMGQGGAMALSSAMLGLAYAPLITPHGAMAAYAEKNQTSQVELATSWEKQLDPSAYAVSEKLDGVRAVWDGKALRFRSGLLINAPLWFLESLPKEPLDGELWMGRGTFDALSGAVRKADPMDAEWKKITYMVFDSPHPRETFSQRSLRLQQQVRKAHIPWLKAIDQTEVADAEKGWYFTAWMHLGVPAGPMMCANLNCKQMRRRESLPIFPEPENLRGTWALCYLKCPMERSLHWALDLLTHSAQVRPRLVYT
jgi:hypothetical protein